MVAFRGSLASPTPAERNAFTRSDRTMRSLPRACRVRGATRIEPMADESVAPARPMGMMGPQTAIWLMTS